jgi:hypothetical protein
VHAVQQPPDRDAGEEVEGAFLFNNFRVVGCVSCVVPGKWDIGLDFGDATLGETG